MPARIQELPVVRMRGLPPAVLRVFVAACFVLTCVLGANHAIAQKTAQETAQKTEQEPAQEENTPLSEPEIEQLVAPIALHPDALLSQIFMASTYPLEVVEAQRWVKDNPGVKGKALEDAMEKQPWDPSVKSLTAFPEVLEMMSDELSWTQQLGDVFLAQQEQVLEAVQNLRARAEVSGNLKTTKEQKVEYETVTSSSGSKERVIVIEQSNPEVIYVPSYDPTVVYGTWAYPSYPPYYWYPRGYVAGSVFWFATGVAVGNALWGRCDWRRGDVNINVNRYNNFNRTNISNKNWSHNSVHRKGVPYGNRKVSNRYGKGRNDVRSKSRDKFRGRADSGRKNLASVKPGDIKRPGQGGKRPNLGGKQPNISGKRPNLSANKPGAKRPATKRPASKPKQKIASRPAAKKPKKVSRPAKKPTAFKGVGNGKQVRRNSSRGKASRKSSHARRGGGGKRGGGGRRGGGRRR